ncbi:hypothetical protein BH11ACT2_BH11ACT2_06970 [soil metagenome]
MLAAAAVLLLSGCVAAPALPPRASEGAARTASQADLAREWSSLQLTVSRPMPAYPTAPLVPLAGWAGKMNACTAATPAAPFFHYSGSSQTSTADPSDPRYDEAQIANFLCETQNPLDFRDLYLMSRAQVDYLYDYDRTWLVPCLELRGYRVTGIPSRATFRERQVWTPYARLPLLSTLADGSGSVKRLRALLAACPAFPVGLPMSNIDVLSTGGGAP